MHSVRRFFSCILFSALVLACNSALAQTLPGRDGQKWLAPKTFFGMTIDEIQWTLAHSGYRLATRTEVAGLIGNDSDDPEPGLAYLAKFNAIDMCTKSNGEFVYGASGIFDTEVRGDFADLALNRPAFGFVILEEGFFVTIEDKSPRVGFFGANRVSPECTGAFAIEGQPTFCGTRDRQRDLDCDGKDDFIVFRRVTGEWFIRRSRIRDVVFRNWGRKGDIPLVGDFTGDHVPDLVVYRPSNGTWYIYSLVDSSTIRRQWGKEGDAPILSDFDGDGIQDLVVYREAEGVFYGRNASETNTRFFIERWGLQSKDVPLGAARP